MGKISNRQYAKALYEVGNGLTGADLSMVLNNFVRLLSKNHHLSQADNIIFEFENYAKKQAGVVEIEITSARKIDDKTIAEIKKIFGTKVEATQKVDESLIGGVSIRTEDKILDGSIRTQLDQLQQHFA